MSDFKSDFKMIGLGFCGLVVGLLVVFLCIPAFFLLGEVTAKVMAVTGGSIMLLSACYIWYHAIRFVLENCREK